LVVLLIGVIEIGRAAFFSIAVTNAARSSVQYGAQSPVTANDNNATNIKQAALDDAPFLSPDDVTFAIICECLDGTVVPCSTASTVCSGRVIPYLKVNTQMNLTPLIGFPGLPSSFSLNGEAMMRIGH
jgi:hypothetical protein